jgi:serine/threonine protein kinase
MLALEGRQLGNYDVIKRIRVGGMGAVYEGKQRTAFGRRVAIKVILGNYADDPDMRRRFAREARIVARLHHPHILPLIEFGDEQGILYLVMPFIEGGTLTSYLRRSLPDLSEVAAIFLQLLDAVEYAHDEGLIHRDIKSSNVLLELRRSGPPYAYLADFGLVRTMQQAELEQTGNPIPLDQIPGTPHYMAPEQTRGIVTASTDIYALGVLLYQMLVGKLPYDDPDEVKVIQMHLHAPIPSPSERDASIPEELGEVVRTAMAKHAEDRFASIAEFRQAFLAAIEGPIVTVKEDIPPAKEAFSAPERRISVPLRSSDFSEPPDTPAPILVSPPAPPPLSLQRRPQRVVTPPPPLVRRPIRRPVAAKRKRFNLSMVAAMLVPLLLLALLLIPRLWGVGIFPPGFPVFGSDPAATVTVTAQSKTLHDVYRLTASSQVKRPDLANRVIPYRTVQGQSTGSATKTTSTKITSAAQATGSLLFVNSSDSSVSVPTDNIFTTDSGVQVRLTQSVDVPPHQKGKDGTISAPAVAVKAGAAGNISADAINTICCGGLSVSNPDPFTGGVDAGKVHVVTQADLDAVKKGLSPRLQQQVLQQLQRQLSTNEVMVGQPTYTTRVSSDQPVGTQADRVLVTVTESGMAMVYDHEVARQMAAQLLSQKAMQTLGNNYQLHGTISMGTPPVVQQGQDGLLFLDVSVHGFWVYTLSPLQWNQWRQSIKGATAAAAIAYLNSQPGVAAVQIRLPFGTDHLPSSVDQIEIVVTNN